MDHQLERQYLEVELYEKIIIRERRRRLVLITLALTLFMFLCGIPVYNERKPKWESLRAAKNIAVEIEKLKTESLRLKKALQLSVLDDGQIKITQVSNCSSAVPDVHPTEESLHQNYWMRTNGDLVLLSDIDAKKLKLNLAVHQICFDPVSGINFPKIKKVFVIVPVKDLAESRLDRASYVEVESSSGRISIN